MKPQIAISRYLIKERIKKIVGHWPKIEDLSSDAAGNVLLVVTYLGKSKALFLKSTIFRQKKDYVERELDKRLKEFEAKWKTDILNLSS